MGEADLYAIYADAYEESSHFRSGRAAAGLTRRLRQLLSVERAIGELGRHDATDGRAMRTRAEFEDVIRQGRRALGGLDVPLEAGT